MTSAPLYYEGMVFIGPVGSEYGVRGFMEAFNAKTGALVWKHYNIPAPGEFGHESWPTGTECHECDNEWEHGGATTWNAPTVDPKDGDIYYSTANAGGGGIGGGKNGGDYGGSTRTGADLWTVSMLALNYKTGELAWGYQQVHHDIWDFDSSTQPDMIDVEIGGKKVEGILQANKDGYAYFVNAATGQPVFPIEEKPAPQSVQLMGTYPTQPVPTMPPFNPPKADPEELRLLKEEIKTSAAALKVPVPMVTTGGGPEGSSRFVPYGELAANGAKLWTFEIGAGPSMISVYEYGSKERVSIYGGGNADGDTKHGDFLWQFSLNGTGPTQKECAECIGPALPESIRGLNTEREVEEETTRGAADVYRLKDRSAIRGRVCRGRGNAAAEEGTDVAAPRGGAGENRKPWPNCIWRACLCGRAELYVESMPVRPSRVRGPRPGGSGVLSLHPLPAADRLEPRRRSRREGELQVHRGRGVGHTLRERVRPPATSAAFAAPAFMTTSAISTSWRQA